MTNTTRRQLPTLTADQIDGGLGFVQTVPTDVLTAAMRGELDLLAVVAAELAARGVDVTTGAWVGFAQAREAATAHLQTLPEPTRLLAGGATSHVVRGPGGRRVRVTIPTA